MLRFSYISQGPPSLSTASFRHSLPQCEDHVTHSLYFRATGLLPAYCKCVSVRIALSCCSNGHLRNVSGLNHKDLFLSSTTCSVQMGQRAVLVALSQRPRTAKQPPSWTAGHCATGNRELWVLHQQFSVLSWRWRMSFLFSTHWPKLVTRPDPTSLEPRSMTLPWAGRADPVGEQHQWSSHILNKYLVTAFTSFPQKELMDFLLPFGFSFISLLEDLETKKQCLSHSIKMHFAFQSAIFFNFIFLALLLPLPGLLTHYEPFQCWQ